MKFPQIQPISLKLAGCIYNVDVKYWGKFELNPIIRPDIRPDIRIGYFRMYVSPDDKTFFHPFHTIIKLMKTVWLSGQWIRRYLDLLI